MRSKFFSFIALLADVGAHAEDVDLEKVVGSLIAEKAYAKLAGEKGFREASISVLADDAVIFAPHAVNGKKVLAGSEERTVTRFCHSERSRGISNCWLLMVSEVSISLDMTNHFFGSARRIKSPSQSGFATPSRYARSDSTAEFTRRLL
jgi:hypothetical protein